VRITRADQVSRTNKLKTKIQVACTLIFLLALVLSNVEVPELIDVAVLVGCNHAKPIPHIVLLQVLLGQVFQVPYNTENDSIRMNHM
jgi:hypothetical protein